MLRSLPTSRRQWLMKEGSRPLGSLFEYLGVEIRCRVLDVGLRA